MLSIACICKVALDVNVGCAAGADGAAAIDAGLENAVPAASSDRSTTIGR